MVDYSGQLPPGCCGRNRHHSWMGKRLQCETTRSLLIYKTLLESRDGEELLKPLMVELLMLGAECSLVGLKTDRSSRLLPPGKDLWQSH